MIELKLKIKQQEKQDYKNLVVTEINVESERNFENATKQETEVLQIFEGKLGLDKKVQVMHKD